MKLGDRQTATALRQKGWTYAAIQSLLGVSKGTLSNWLRDVAYQPTNETTRRRQLASIAAGQVLHQRKLQRVARIQDEAEQSLPPVDKQILHFLGIMAYWAEGAKTQDRVVAFTNTDPVLIQLVQKWWLECCDVQPERLRFRIRVHTDTAVADAEEYWGAITGIPKNQWDKTTVKECGSGGRRIRKLRYGIATIKVCDTIFFYRIQGWIRGLTSQFDLPASVAQQAFAIETPQCGRARPQT